MRDVALDIYFAHKGEWKPCAAARVVWKLYEYHKVEGRYNSYRALICAIERKIDCMA